MNDYHYYLEKNGEYGIAEKVTHPLVSISGLANVHANELVISEENEVGVVFSIDETLTQILLLSTNSIKVGTQFARTNEYIFAPVGAIQLGWVVDPLGSPMMGAGTYSLPKDKRSIETKVKGISERARIKKRFETGINIVDVVIPLGMGQKELIIGDKKTGKTAFVLNIIKNQAQMGTVVIYAAIGHRKNDIKKVYEYCVRENIVKNVVIVAASSDNSPSLVYLTPFSAMTLAEYFRDQGRDVLLILDDLSTHARFYREISLVAQHFPGRESYPGDIFYIHARLLERAGNYKVGEKEVAITCLPIVETVESDLSSYIPTNVMGMTDGHIFFDNNAFYNGLRPAINSTLSVTRVGKQTQTKLQREINREITLFLTSFEKMQTYSHFGAELSAKVQKILQKGDLLNAFFQQDYTRVIPSDVQLIIFGMIWSSLLETKEQVNEVKEKLSEAYSKNEIKELLQSCLKVDSLYDFQTNINGHRSELMQFANAPADKPAPAPVPKPITQPAPVIPSTELTEKDKPWNKVSEKNT